MRVLADATFVRRVQVKKQKINDTIKVGPGKLKLIYFGNQEKLAQYINSKRDCFSLALFLIQYATQRQTVHAGRGTSMLWLGCSNERPDFKKYIIFLKYIFFYTINKK